MKLQRLLPLLIINVLISCKPVEKEFYGNDFRLFRGTPAWGLARAVHRQDVSTIRRLAIANPTLLRYQEPRFGENILLVAVIRERDKAVQALLKAGADPNLQDTYSGTSALMEAAKNYDSSAPLRLLLSHGGNPNDVGVSLRGGVREVRPETPLILAARHRLESVKLLVEAGANINYNSGPPYYESALHSAFTLDKLDIIRYLILDKGADVTQPMNVTIKGDTLRINDSLRRLVFPLNSVEYRQKMELVRFLEKKGVNYWNTPIPKHYYTIYSKEFLKQY